MEQEKILMGQTWHLMELAKVGKVTLMGIDEITGVQPLGRKGGDWGD